jgi:hypothetical protein
MSVSEACRYTTLSAELDDAVEYEGRRSKSLLDVVTSIRSAQDKQLPNLSAELDDLAQTVARQPADLLVERKTTKRSAPTFCTFLRELSSRRRTHGIVLEELSGVSQGPMIIRMTTTSRPQQRYDHRLRDLVQRTGELTIATDLGVPRSTARGKRLHAEPRLMFCSIVTRPLTSQFVSSSAGKVR